MSRLLRFVTVLGAAAVLMVLSASTASAHVEVSPDTAVGGSEAELTFRAPNEEAAAQFTKLVIHLPPAQPLASLATRPIPGWTASLAKSKLSEPLTTDNGTTTEYTSTVTWTATDGGVAPDQYQNFDISVGPLPASGTMTFTADQTYSDGTVVHWDEIAKPGAAEPDHPAPVLTLTAATADSSKADSSDGLARALGIAGIVLGVTGLSAAGLALRRKNGAAA